MGGWFHLPLAAAAQREVEWGGGREEEEKGLDRLVSSMLFCSCVCLILSLFIRFSLIPPVFFRHTRKRLQHALEEENNPKKKFLSFTLPEGRNNKLILFF